MFGETITSPTYHELQFARENCQAKLRLAADHWDHAYDLWLNSRSSFNTQRAYRKAWQLLLQFVRKEPAQITSTDIAGWIQSQHAAGLSSATILQRLAAISSFYTYATRTYTLLGSDGRENPLHHYNPVAAIPRPKVSPYGKAKFLSVEQARVFLRAIPTTYPQGLRDYALFLGYLITGRRNSEIRTLLWGDFEVETLPSPTSGRGVGGEGKIFYRWSGKGKVRRDECPLSFWQAITDFLKVTGHLETISPDDYIFTALNNNASRLPNVKFSNNSACSDDAWSFSEKNSQAVGNQQPMSARQVGKLVKRYAYRAGLDPRRVSVHTLRHTAAMLRKEAGEDVEAISKFLNHSSLSVTQVYLHTIEGHNDNTWLKVEALLGLADEK